MKCIPFNQYTILLINSMLLLSIQPKLSLQYKIINSANIKKLSQYRYWLSFFILTEFIGLVISPRAARGLITRPIQKSSRNDIFIN
jgi:hypothetical protein